MITDLMSGKLKKTAVLLIACWIIPAVAATASGADFTDSVRFFVLEQFFVQTTEADSGGLLNDPAYLLARFLARHHQGDSLHSATEGFAGNPDPLRIPNPFDVTAQRSPRLLSRITTHLEHHGLTFDLAYPADFAEAEQIAARRISSGYPVIALHPHPFLLLGYDYREDDPFWYLARFAPEGRVEITTRSAWRADWWLWEPHPTSIILVEITGRDSALTEQPPPEELFAHLLSTAKTDTATGAVSYIRPILRMIDSLSEANEPPRIVRPAEDSEDPLFLRRAERQRLLLQRYLESLVSAAEDAEVQQNLRLAIFSAGKAADEFAAMRGALYGEDVAPGDSVSVIDRVGRRWLENRLNAADFLTEVVRWERQMLAALKDIVAANRPFGK